jgi:DNA-binding response OmpR family regulator
MATAPQQDDVVRAGALEVHRADGLVLAEGRVVPVSVRELGLLVALLDHRGGIVRRDDLYAEVWGTPMRAGDRSIDVYVHKLRTKLEDALPAWRFIHTHVGFGYRLDPEPA